MRELRALACQPVIGLEEPSWATPCPRLCARCPVTWMQGKGKFPVPLHPIPSKQRSQKCQECLRSKMSDMSPTVYC